MVLAAAGRLDDACELIHQVGAPVTAVEPRVLISVVEALRSIGCREPEALDLVVVMEETAFSTGALDLLVAAYRTSAELLAMLLRASRDPDRLGMLIRRVGDEDLAQAVGRPIVLSDDDQRERLTPREREVYELLCQGLRNRQIAEMLFISEGTVKLHAHHIYDKLGTRSRTALAMQAALERAGQATSATGESGTGAAP
jgi:DNA-binding NarL/FixJ family response regulator